MRLDVVTIFPEYLVPLDLSIIGKARRDGLLDVRAHNLRDVTTDRHHTVDDTPYGGGAGMVMKPDVWGAALDQLLAEAEAAGTRPRLIVPGPGGVPFTQILAHELAAEKHLVFACGRYEGVDERVYEYARERFPGGVDVVSLGDYVLNGGEVAVLAMAEAIVRLVPGVVGNAESLVEESHEDGLLEYPVYTKPPVWQGREVPSVLLSGDHAAIAAWRHQQRLERTAARRPDLLARSSVVTGEDGEATVTVATPSDAGELYTLLRATVPARVTEPFGEFAAALREQRREGHATTLVARSAGRLIGAVRHRTAGGEHGNVREIEVLAVAPDLRGHGIGRALLAAATAGDPARTPVCLPSADAAHGGRGEGNEALDLDRFMRRAGYRSAGAPGRWQRKKRR